MFRLLTALQSLLPRAESQRDSDHAYLAHSVDAQDFERRLQTLDERGRNPFGAIALGLYAR